MRPGLGEPTVRTHIFSSLLTHLLSAGLNSAFVTLGEGWRGFLRSGQAEGRSSRHHPESSGTGSKRPPWPKGLPDSPGPAVRPGHLAGDPALGGTARAQQAPFPLSTLLGSELWAGKAAAPLLATCFGRLASSVRGEAAQPPNGRPRSGTQAESGLGPS